MINFQSSCRTIVVFLCIIFFFVSPKLAGLSWERVHIPTMSVCLKMMFLFRFGGIGFLVPWTVLYVPCKARDMEPRQRMVGESQGLNPSLFLKVKVSRNKAEFSIKTRVTWVLGTGIHIYNSLYVYIYVYTYICMYICMF